MVDLASKESFEKKAIKPIVIASHPRSGTHLLMDFIRKQFATCKVSRRLFQYGFEPYINLDEMISIENKVSKNDLRLLLRSKMPILKTHRLPDYYEPFQFLNPVAKEREWLADYFQEKSIIIYVYRDVLKTLVSLYEFYPINNRAGSFGEFIREVRGKRQLSRVGFWAKHLSTWFREENVLVLNFDQIIYSSLDILNRVSAHIDQSPIHVQPLLPVKPRNRVVRKLGYLLTRDPESTAILTFNKNRFSVRDITEEDKLFIENEIRCVASELIGTDAVIGLR